MRLWISIKSQCIELYDCDGMLIRRYPVSTARNGAGETNGSNRTPRGRHIIRAKIGAGARENAVFLRRRPNGEVWTPEFAAAHPGRDWILTRILWLSGCEPGLNRLGDVDTMRRYIYLHGSPDSVPMGVPGSIGCVRMRNRDIMELFDLVPAYTPVEIVEYAVEEGSWAHLGPEAGVVREAVFVREQGFPLDEEYDGFDASSTHVLARDPGDEAIGTARLLPDGRIGRLAVLPEWRRKGVGRALLSRLTETARQRGIGRLTLHAQLASVGFYRGLGFSEDGQPFDELGIPHVLMGKNMAPYSTG